MREAMIICPKASNDGASLALVQRKAIGAMVDAFGGCTVADAFGHWRDDSGAVVSEPVWQLIAAADDTADNDAALREIARDIGSAGRQWCMYVRYPSGAVEFVDTAKLWQSAAAVA